MPSVDLFLLKKTFDLLMRELDAIDSSMLGFACTVFCGKPNNFVYLLVKLGDSLEEQ